MIPQLSLDGFGAVETGRPRSAALLEIAFQGHFGAKAVPCPICHAPIGVFCRRPSGWAGRFAHYHLARRALAGKVTLVGLECSRCQVPDGPEHYVFPASNEPEFQAVGVAGRPLCGACATMLVPESRPTFD